MAAGPRWQTVAQSGQEDVARKLEGNYDNEGKQKAMKERKLANTRTSISFGNEHPDYISDAKANQAKAYSGSSTEERAAQKQRLKQMKAELTVTNFSLGDERPDYESVNHAAMSAAEGFRDAPKVAMNADLKAMIKKSSLHLGNEPVSYVTVGQESMSSHNNTTDFAGLKAEVKEMTKTLRKHNFSFGDEKVAYTTDYASGYGTVPLDAYGGQRERKESMKKTVNDMRACHFSLGNDAPHYMSNSQQAYEAAGACDPDEIAADRARTKDMSKALRKTSIVIGDDPQYL